MEFILVNMMWILYMLKWKMWPGTISIFAQKCPMGGTAMFAFLALAGDLGGTVGPSMVVSFSGMAGGNLKIGLLFALYSL